MPGATKEAPGASDSRIVLEPEASRPPAEVSAMESLWSGVPKRKLSSLPPDSASPPSVSLPAANAEPGFNIAPEASRAVPPVMPAPPSVAPPAIEREPLEVSVPLSRSVPEATEVGPE